eukprot:6284057-Prymnesium_polylepis.1
MLYPLPRPVPVRARRGCAVTTLSCLESLVSQHRRMPLILTVFFKIKPVGRTAPILGLFVDLLQRAA